MGPRTEKEDRIRELRRELRALQSIFDQILERYTINTKAKIDEIIRALDGGDSETKLPGKKEIERMVLTLQKMQIKPEKGRFKDIRKINGTINDIFSGFSVP
jgi:hypothetical protein